MKYFGEESALGQVLMIRDTIPLTVTGVYEDLPAQSHFHFNMLISLLSAEGLYNNDQWFANNFETYMRLEPGFPGEAWRPSCRPLLINTCSRGNMEIFRMMKISGSSTCSISGRFTWDRI